MAVFPGSRGGGVVSGQIGGGGLGPFCVLTSLIPRYPGLLVPPQGL
jgi:hypothetical protein